MGKLKDKNCVITGAASGIGRSLAIGLAKEGMNLFLSDINMERLEDVKEEIEALGNKVHVARCDVTKYEDFAKSSILCICVATWGKNVNKTRACYLS